MPTMRGSRGGTEIQRVFAILRDRARRVSSTPLAGGERLLDTGPDQFEGYRERRVYIQIARVEQDRVGSWHERGHLAPPVAVVPLANIRKDFRFRNAPPR